MTGFDKFFLLRPLPHLVVWQTPIGFIPNLIDKLRKEKSQDRERLDYLSFLQEYRQTLKTNHPRYDALEKSYDQLALRARLILFLKSENQPLGISKALRCAITNLAGLIARDLGQYQEAQTYFENALALLEPENLIDRACLLSNLASNLAEEDREREALQGHEKAFEFFSLQPALWNEQGPVAAAIYWEASYCRRKFGDLEKAAKYALQAWLQWPECLEVATQWGLCEMKAGTPESLLRAAKHFDVFHQQANQDHHFETLYYLAKTHLKLAEHIHASTPESLNFHSKQAGYFANLAMRALQAESLYSKYFQSKSRSKLQALREALTALPKPQPTAETPPDLLEDSMTNNLLYPQGRSSPTLFKSNCSPPPSLRARAKQLLSPSLRARAK